MERAAENAMVIADYLNKHSRVEKVVYPGLTHHPQHALAKSQMKSFGAMISFDLKDNQMDMAKKVMEKLHYFTLAESLGGVESLVSHPASMTHASIPPEERIKSGLTDSMIRLSVGIEDKDDLIKDLEQALA